MKLIYFSLLPLLLFGSNMDSNNNSVEIDDVVTTTVNGQVIKILLDSVNNNELKNEKLGVIIFSKATYVKKFKPINILIWFRYRCDNQFVTINYFSFSEHEKFNDQFFNQYNNVFQKHKQFQLFLQEIVTNKKNINSEYAKQLKELLPIGLQNDILFNKMRKIDPLMLSKEEARKLGISETNRLNIRYSKTGDYDLCYWGFKSNKIEFIRDYKSYGNNIKLKTQIENEIISPIVKTILEHETPEHWKEDYKKYEEEQNKNISKTPAEISESDRKSASELPGVLHFMGWDGGLVRYNGLRDVWNSAGENWWNIPCDLDNNNVNRGLR